MPTVGGVFIRDDLMPRMEARRPGYGELLASAASDTVNQVRFGVPYALRKATGNITPEQEQQYQQNLGKQSLAAPASVDDLTSGRVGFGRFLGENLIGSLPYMAGSLAGGLAGFAATRNPVGTIAGAVAGGTPQFVGSNVDRAVQEQGGLSEQSATKALVVAPFQSAADAAIARFLPGAGKVLGEAAATQAGGFLRRTAASMIEAGATEAVTEAAQQVGERYVAGKPLGNADAVGEYVNAAVTAFAVGGVLGAGGGFRRSEATTKPVNEVTEDDMLAHVDGVLSGELRALPSPEMFGRQPQGPEVSSGPTIVQDDRPLQSNPDFIVDSEGRIAPPGFEGEQAIAIDRNQPTVLQNTYLGNVTPEVQAVLDQATAPGEAPLTASTALDRGLQGTSIEPPLSTQQITPPEAVPGIPRVAPVPPVTPATPINRETGEDIPFDKHLADLKKGLRGGFVQQVNAVDEMDLMTKVYDQVFIEQDTRANTAKFAQRLGILDENLQPTELAQYIEEQKAAAEQAAPAAPAAPSAAMPAAEVPAVTEQSGKKGARKSDTASWWASGTADLATTPELAGGSVEMPAPQTPQTQQLRNGSPRLTPEIEAEMAAARKAAGIQRVTSTKGLETPVDVFRALANDASDAQVSQVEKLAQKLGLITDDDARDVTPKGRQVYLTSSEGLTDAVNAAQEQGYTGKQASIFERGVRSVTSGQTTSDTFESFEDMAAHQAGQVWARDFIQNGDGTRTAAQTNAIQARLTARKPDGSAARPSPQMRVDNAAKSPAELQRRSLNELVDNADLSTVADQEVVQLRRMIAEGATAEQVGKAIQQLQGGGTIRMAPPRPTIRPIEGTSGRGQPVFREMNRPGENAPSKAAQRAENEAAVRTYDLRNLIQMALAEKAITDVRAAKLHALLDEGKVDQVDRVLSKQFDENQTTKSRQRRELPVPPEQEAQVAENGDVLGDGDPEFERAIEGKTFTQVLDHMVVNAPSLYHREIAKMMKAMAVRLEKAGMELNVVLVKPGTPIPRGVNNPDVRATARMTNVPPVATIYLKSMEMGYRGGTNYQLAMHEMLHALTMRALRFGNTKGVFGQTKLGRAVEDLYALQNAIADHFNGRVDEGNLTEFEQAFLKRYNNSLSNVDEIISWGLTNPGMQRYLASIEYKPRQSVFGRLVELLRNLLGLDAKYDTALTELLRVSQQIMKTPQAELQSMFVRNNPDLTDTVEAAADARSSAGMSAANRTVTASNEVTQGLAKALDAMTDRVDVAELGAKMRRKALGWLSHNQIDRQYGRLMPGLIQHSDAHRERVAVRSRFEQMGDDAYQNFEKLERENAKAAEWVGQLMALTTEFQIDPTKAWEDHKHHLDDKNAPKLRQLHAQAVDLANKMRRGDGTAMKVFNEFRALNEAQNYARMAASLHGLVAMDPELTLGVADADINPVDQFMREEGLTTAEAVRDRWSQLLQKQIAGAVAFVNAKKGEAARGTDADMRAMRSHLSPIELQVSAIHEALAGMQKAPYFHLGRFGDYFGSAVVRKLDGQADPAALKHIGETLEKNGFDDVQISTDNTRPKIALRFDSLDQAKRFQKLMQDLQRQGWLDSQSEIKVGPRSRGDNFGVADGLPDFVQRYIQSIEASPVYVPDEGMDAKERAALEKSKQDAVRLAIDTWLEQQPDSSISKVLVKRYTVPGYNKDMVRNFAHRWRVGSISIANVAAAPKFNQAFVNMRSQVNEATTQDVAEATKLNDILTEMKARDASNPINETADTFDKARAFAHAYFLGLSPAYGMINLTQLGVTALPELAKAHGYSKSFHAMRRASTTAFKILRAAAGEAAALGPKHWADVAITETVLAKAGLSASERNFAMHMLATGTIDIGSAARALGQIAENRVGSKTDMALKYASAMGMYTETFSRLTTALAARELHGSKPGVEQYATKVVSNSMFDYQSWNTARSLGKQGVLGPVTPMVTQFMSYSVQLTEKLYSEALDAFQRPRAGETAAQAKERQVAARRFIGGHLVAVTALAGTLGLPFATVFARAIELMVDKLGDDDEPFDATAAWRSFLADVLGQNVAEVVSRGLPRAFGFDISARAGEQNLLPFSEFLADRRPWKEALGSMLESKIGAVPSMVSNIVTGGAKIADGDVLGGMKDMLPVAFKGPIETYRMTTDGYVDTKGNKMPMTPGASAYLWQLLGFSPAERAEYSEARGDQQARRGEITRRAEVLRKRIVRAMIAGDREEASSLIRDAQEFDRDNPSFAVIPSLSGAMTRQLQSRARAQALNTPLGVSMQDIAGQNMTRYANVDYAQ